MAFSLAAVVDINRQRALMARVQQFQQRQPNMMMYLAPQSHQSQYLSAPQTAPTQYAPTAAAAVEPPAPQAPPPEVLPPPTPEGKPLPKTRKIKPPSVTPAVAEALDNFTSIDDIRTKAAILRRAAYLRRQGYTESSDLRVRPPKFAEEAIAAGGIPPQSFTTSDGLGQPETTPSSLVYAAQGNYKGVVGVNPLTAAREQEAMAVAKTQSVAEVSQMSMPVPIVGSGASASTGYGVADTASEALPGLLLTESVGIAEGVGNNAGGGAPPPPPPTVRRSMFKRT